MTMNVDSIKFFKALSDQSRVRIIRSLLEGPKYVELLSERLEIAASTVSFHLKKLEEVGLVEKHKEQYYIVYSIKVELLNKPLIQWIVEDDSEQDQEVNRESAYRKKIVDAFFKFDKLINLPVQKKKKLIVLEHMVISFEEGKEYSEEDVNNKIMKYHEDYATIRKDFVNEGYMIRHKGIYRRIK